MTVLSWWQELGAAGHVVSAVSKPRECLDLIKSFLFSLESQSMG